MHDGGDEEREHSTRSVSYVEVVVFFCFLLNLIIDWSAALMGQ